MKQSLIPTIINMEFLLKILEFVIYGRILCFCFRKQNCLREQRSENLWVINESQAMQTGKQQTKGQGKSKVDEGKRGYFLHHISAISAISLQICLCKISSEQKDAQTFAPKTPTNNLEPELYFPSLSQTHLHAHPFTNSGALTSPSIDFRFRKNSARTPWE